MDKKTKLTLVVSIAIFIIVILGINILIRKSEKEPLPVPQNTEGAVSEREGRLREPKDLQAPQAQEEEKEELEFPVRQQGPLVN